MNEIEMLCCSIHTYEILILSYFVAILYQDFVAYFAEQQT